MKEFELTYSAQKRDFDPARRYANPRYFDGKVKAGVTSVTIIGNWPDVAEAYEAAGIPVAYGLDQPAVKKAKPVSMPKNPGALSWDEARKVANDLGHDVVNRDQAIGVIENATEGGQVQSSGEELGTDSGDQFSDEQLRAIIKDVSGKAPHHKLGREKLVAQFNELNAA